MATLMCIVYVVFAYLLFTPMSNVEFEEAWDRSYDEFVNDVGMPL